MSTDYTNEIGYESLLSDFKRYQKQTPRGVGMTKKGQNIYPSESNVSKLISQPGYFREKEVRAALKKARQKLGIRK